MQTAFINPLCRVSWFVVVLPQPEEAGWTRFQIHATKYARLENRLRVLRPSFVRRGLTERHSGLERHLNTRSAPGPPEVRQRCWRCRRKTCSFPLECPAWKGPLPCLLLPERTRTIACTENKLLIFHCSSSFISSLPLLFFFVCCSFYFSSTFVALFFVGLVSRQSVHCSTVLVSPLHNAGKTHTTLKTHRPRTTPSKVVKTELNTHIACSPRLQRNLAPVYEYI